MDRRAGTRFGQRDWLGVGDHPLDGVLDEVGVDGVSVDGDGDVVAGDMCVCQVGELTPDDAVFVLHLFPEPASIGMATLVGGQRLVCALDDFGQVVLVEELARVLALVDGDPGLVTDESEGHGIDVGG